MRLHTGLDEASGAMVLPFSPYCGFGFWSGALGTCCLVPLILAEEDPLYTCFGGLKSSE